MQASNARPKAHLNRVEKYTDWPNHICPHLKTEVHPKAFTFPSGSPGTRLASGVPLSGTATRLNSLWMKSTLHTSHLQFKQKRPVNAHFQETICYTQTTHGSGVCVSLLFLLRDFNARHYLVQWTLLHFHSSGKDFQISHKRDYLKKTFSYSKRKKRNKHHCHHNRCSFLCPV